MTAFYASIRATLERHLHLTCFALGLLCTLPLVFLTPPFQVPDEPQHFYRAYQLSELRLISSIDDNRGGDVLPSSLIDLSSHYLSTRDIHADRSVRKQQFSALVDGSRIPLDPAHREFIDFTGAAFYSPLPYLPQAAAIGTGRSFGWNPLALLYFARFVNAIAAVLLLSMAVQITPIAKPAFMVAGLLPMSAYLFGSVSADAMLIGTAFLFTAVALRAYTRREWQTGDIVTAIACACVFCSIKAVYAPLLLLGLPSAFVGKDRTRGLLIQLAIAAVPIAMTIIWLHAVSGLVTPVKPGTGVAAQIHHVLAHPLFFLAAVAHGFIWNKFYYFSLIGTLGWLTITLPAISYILPAVAFLIAVSARQRQVQAVPVRILAWWSMLAGGCVLLVMLALYCYWTRVAAIMVDGIQGRYFIPVVPFFAVILAGLATRMNWTLSAMRAWVWVPSIIVVEAGVTFFSLAQAFWTA